MIANQNFYDTFSTIFYPMASAMVYGRRPMFFRAERSATAEGENCAYGPTLLQKETATINTIGNVESLGKQLCHKKKATITQRQKKRT